MLQPLFLFPLIAKRYVERLVISAILVKKSRKLSTLIRHVNDKFRDLCNTFGFHFISNNKIVRDFLCSDEFYLNEVEPEFLSGGLDSRYFWLKKSSEVTNFKSIKGTLIDVPLTNKPYCYQKNNSSQN